MILVVDNYDSFVHNLARYIRLLGLSTEVVRNDAITVDEVRRRNPAAVVLSPGPCAPKQAGCCLELVAQLHRELPILGVCLGHQVIAESFGADIVCASEPVHGRASPMEHDQQCEFKELENPLRVGRYHSLVVCPSKLPSELQVSAKLADGTIMALRHRSHSVVGWQFHPESLLTDQGSRMLEAYFRGLGISLPRPSRAAPALSSDARQLQPQPDWFRRAIDYP